MNINNSIKILDDDDIIYMFSILNLNINEKEKAKRLYLFCDDITLEYNIMYFKNKNSFIKLRKLKELLIIYIKYKQKGLLDFGRNYTKIKSIVYRNKINSR